jgi:hypothetical protein
VDFGLVVVGAKHKSSQATERRARVLLAAI